MSTPNADTATAALIKRLDLADAAPGAAELRARSYDLLHLDRGATVVDVGCGSGRAVAELVERGTRPTGIDPSPTMLEAARTRWPALDFRRATADFLPLPDVSMSGYRADKVFHEIASPTTALAEAQRVLRPGGRIVLLGQDWDAIIIDSDHPEITRTLVHARADTITNPRAARAHRTILLDNGFHDTTVEAHTSLFTTPEILPMLTALAESAVTTTAVSRDDVDTWLTDQTARARSNRLFVTLPIFIAAGTRP